MAGLSSPIGLSSVVLMVVQNSDGGADGADALQKQSHFLQGPVVLQSYVALLGTGPDEGGGRGRDSNWHSSLGSRGVALGA